MALLLSACATTPQSAQQAAEHQTAVIDRWHRCLDNSFERLSNTGASIEGQIETTKVVCQGHREDVLASFPRHMEKALDNVMAEQVYETGLKKATGSEKIDVNLQSLTRTTLAYPISGLY